MLERFHAAPLPSSFFFMAILGLFLSALYYHFGKLSPSFAFSFMLVFGIMCVASIISMERAPVEDILALDRKR
ncbi:MAG: hypothetical protein Q7R76_06755 [Candidatus Woesearchaeota archaeon]|nr:hypothetical protein [Candidatus Woesearchaeota archaeon]